MITSTSNPQVKQLIQLQRKAKERSAADAFIAEGPKMAREVPDEDLLQLYCSETYYRNHPDLPEEDRRLTVLSDRVFESISDTKTPQGVLCLVKRRHCTLSDLLPSAEGRNALLVALENLQDPGNLGTILRTAEAAGATGILLGPDCVDLYNPKVIRSTMGAVFRLPFFVSDDLRRELKALRARGVKWAAAHLEGDISYEAADYRGPCGFLIGNESRGLTRETVDCADILVRIPMSGEVESLNAAVASAVLLYEADRQRRQADRGC